MKRLVWGIIVVSLGVLSIAGAANNPVNPAQSVWGGLLLIGGGALMAQYGNANRKRKNRVADAAFRMLRETGQIRGDVLASAAEVSEYQARCLLRQLMRNGAIPLHSEIV
jgi:hypothetical protein